MSAVFANASERSRAEPMHAQQHPTAAGIFARGFDAGDRYGYARGWRYGLLCGATIVFMLLAVALISVGAV